MPVTIHDVGFSLHALSLLWVVLRVHVTPRKVSIARARPWAQSTCACWHSTPRRKSLTAHEQALYQVMRMCHSSLLGTCTCTCTGHIKGQPPGTRGPPAHAQATCALDSRSGPQSVRTLVRAAARAPASSRMSIPNPRGCRLHDHLLLLLLPSNVRMLTPRPMALKIKLIKVARLQHDVEFKTCKS